MPLSTPRRFVACEQIWDAAPSPPHTPVMSTIRYTATLQPTTERSTGVNEPADRPLHVALLQGTYDSSVRCEGSLALSNACSGVAV
jgi:hypothetical protein